MIIFKNIPNDSATSLKTVSLSENIDPFKDSIFGQDSMLNCNSNSNLNEYHQYVGKKESFYLFIALKNVYELVNWALPPNLGL